MDTIPQAPEAPGDPLAGYQWSVARINQTTVFFKRALVVLVVIVAAMVLSFQLWNNISIRGSVSIVKDQGSALKAQVASLKAQQTAYHVDTVARDATDQCEIQGYNKIMTYLTVATADAKTHKRPPPFVYPKPC